MTYADDIATWDAEAACFDEAADHGLRDPDVRRAWRSLLLGLLPAAPARIADLGCGTGTLAVLLAAEGHAVDGVDFSPAMVRLAQEKGSGVPGVSFVEGDAATPPLNPAAYDVVLCRHVLWALPDPVVALARWLDLLRPGGSLVLMEGHWSNTAGLRMSETLALVEGAGCVAEGTRLPEPAYWGREIDDERYVVVGRPVRAR